MAEPVTAARAVTMAARAVLAGLDPNREDSLPVRVSMTVCGVLAGLTLLFYIMVEILLLPEDQFSSWLTREGAADTRGRYGEILDRPVIDTEGEGEYSLPCTVTTVSSWYGGRADPLTGGRDSHEGIDFPLAFSSPVLSVADGEVVETGIHNSYGQYIMIRHQHKRPELWPTEEFYSFYAHLSKIYVFVGQQVEEGSSIAESGGDPALHFAGRSTGAHLHLEIRLDGSYSSHVDPYDYIIKPMKEEDEEEREED